MSEQPKIIIEIHNSKYKIGAHGLGYRWNGEEWVKSTKTAEEIRTATKNSRFQEIYG